MRDERHRGVQSAAVRALRRGARWAVSEIGADSWLIRLARPLYGAALRIATGGRGIHAYINDVPCRLDPRFRWIPRTYEPEVAAFLRERVRPGALCLDVGANLGVYVIQLAYWSRPDGRVLAFEPNPVARGALDTHVRLNRLGERVEVIACAVGARPGHATLHATQFDGRSRLGKASSLILASSEPITVPVTSIDDFCTRRRIQPDWVLIDIEGFEVAALEGAHRLITASERRLGLVMECHPDVWDISGTSRADFETLLRDLSLFPVPLTGQRDPLGEYGAVYLQYR